MRLPSEALARGIERVEPVDPDFAARALERQSRLTKPPGSLGRLESVAIQLASIQKNDRPETFDRAIVVFAADHGVTAEGVSPYPSEVTAQMLANFMSGGAAINALAHVAGARVVVVDVGAKRGAPSDAVGDRVRFASKVIREGTGNFAREWAMTLDQASAAIEVGMAEARRLVEEGVRLVGLGEMGIGNTTAASAITTVLTGRPVREVTGRGTGLDDPRLAHKVEVIERALALHQPSPDEPIELLAKVGGLEIAALVGFCLEAAAGALTIVADGFITTAALAIAARLCPTVCQYVVFSHLSSEPGHRALLDLLGGVPLLDLDLRLGEGTGAALAMPVVEAAVAAFNEMATFDSAQISDRG